MGVLEAILHKKSVTIFTNLPFQNKASYWAITKEKGRSPNLKYTNYIIKTNTKKLKTVTIIRLLFAPVFFQLNVFNILFIK